MLRRITVCHKPRTWQYVRPLSNSDRFVSIGDVKCQLRTPESPELVPRGYLGNLSSPEVLEHIRWIVQKRLMKQDIFLLGFPSNLRRRLIMAAAELCDWEVEYIAITRDTTESDLKQRREIVGDSVAYFNQAPVRAAIHGRVLIIDGIENAERNVLPSLNNLLENREMSLDDGSFLTGKKLDAETPSSVKLLSVHPDFQVVALGLPVPPFPGRSLDPPLRSRFQCRYIDDLSSDNIIKALDPESTDMKNAEKLIHFYEVVQNLRHHAISESVSLSGLPVVSTDFFTHSMNLMRRFPLLSDVSVIARSLPVVAQLNTLLPSRFQYSISEAIATLRRHRESSTSAGAHSESTYKLTSVSAVGAPEDIVTATFTPVQKSDASAVVSLPCGPHLKEPVAKAEALLLNHQYQILGDLLMDHSCGKHLAILGPKGSGKTIVARSFGSILGYDVHIFPLYNDLSARDLLQRRSTDKDGNTSQWIDSPLVAAAKAGDLCVLDGMERLDIHSLVSLKRFLQDGVVDLPDGSRLSISSPEMKSEPGSVVMKDSFRVIALSLPPSTTSNLDDSRQRWVTSDMGFSCHFLPGATTADIQHVLRKNQVGMLGKSERVSEQTVEDFHYLLNKSLNYLLVASDQHKLPEFAPSLRHAVRLQRVLFSSLSNDVSENKRHLRNALDGTFLVKFMSSVAANKFELVMQTLGLGYAQLPVHSSAGVTDGQTLAPSETHNAPIESLTSETGVEMLRIGNTTVEKRIANNYQKVPSPLFHENSLQTKLLEEMLQTYSSGITSMLLIGNQGVGKNKLVDRLLELLNAEREYIQLHRDTTVQSLTVLPNLINGKITYDDSPLVRAAKEGTVLVIDEADKAPVEVVCLLKMLVEDGELPLQDGRRLLTADRKAALLPSHLSSNIIEVHPNFRLIALANRPGFPFHGNNFFRECGDVLTTHVIDNLDLNSEIELLRAYGPDVPVETLTKLALCFQDLRTEHAAGRFSYPFSAREAVAVVKHAQAYPYDGVAAAVEDFLGFEGATPKMRKMLAEIFRSRGIPVPLESPMSIGASNNTMHNSVRLSAPAIVADPVEQQLSMSKYSSCPSDWIVEEKGTKSKAWNISETMTGSYEIDSTRLNIFSEQIGQLSVGASEQHHFSGRVLDMVTDSSGTLHVLSDQPLELHSYYDVANALSRGGAMEKKYVKRTLISEEGSWRMGSTQAILFPGIDGRAIHDHEVTSDISGGVVVLLPELSLALSIGGDVSSDVLTTSLPNLSASVAGKGSKGRRGRHSFMDRLFSDDTSANRKGMFRLIYSTSQGGKHAVMWHEGGSEINFLNLDRSTVTKLSLDSQSKVSSMRFLRCTEDSEEFLLSLEGRTEASVLRIRDAGDTYSRSSSTSPFSMSVIESSDHQNVAQLFNMNGVAAIASYDLDGCVSTIGGNQSTFAGKFDFDSMIYHTWMRHDVSCDTNQSTASCASVYNVVRENEKAGCDILEVIETNPCLRREIKLTDPTNASGSDSNMPAICSISLLKPSSYSMPSACPGGNDEIICLAYSNGCVKFFDANPDRLNKDLKIWQSMFPDRKRNLEVTKTGWGERETDKLGNPKTGLNAPKHGKEDSKNEPHVGGNTWAGGTGGSDTAGLGGRGGPYRLDKGHTVHQVSDEAKEAVSAEAKQKAAEIAKAALRQRLDDISMGKDEYDIYNRFHGRIENQVAQLRTIIDEFSRRSKERVWLRNQSSGELDDSKIVDGLSGEKLVFKRRGIATDSAVDSGSGSNPESLLKRVEMVMDVSGSMYRFNGTDRRLERMLETALMIMSAMPSSDPDSFEQNNILQYCLSGHSGDTEYIPFVQPGSVPQNESERFMILQSMIAHAQFCRSGDHTLEAIDAAINRVIDSTKDDSIGSQRYVLVVSDANFRRYGISTKRLSQVMKRDPRVQVHLILIASLGDEAEKTAAALPDGQCHVCDGSSSTDMVGVFKNILMATGGVLDTSSF